MEFTLSNLVSGALGKRIDISGRGYLQGGKRGDFGGLAYNQSSPIQGVIDSTHIHFYNGPVFYRANGVFVRNQDEKLILGTLSGSEGFFVSNQFGGCDFTVYRDSGNRYVAAHVFSSAACRAAASDPPDGWTILGTWKSTPYVGKWGLSDIYCLAFIEGTILTFVAMKVMGRRIEGRTTPVVGGVTVHAPIPI